MRLPTNRFLGLETDDAYPVSVGFKAAVIAIKPRREGLNVQVATNETDCFDTQPDIRFPFAKKVTFPSVPATPSVADTVTLD